MSINFMIFIFIFCVIIFVLWVAYKQGKEMSMLKSPDYLKAVEEWEAFQEQYKTREHKSFKPFPLLIDTGGWVATEITVRRDEEGKIELQQENLTAKEFIVASNKIRKLLAS